MGLWAAGPLRPPRQRNLRAVRLEAAGPSSHAKQPGVIGGPHNFGGLQDKSSNKQHLACASRISSSLPLRLGLLLQRCKRLARPLVPALSPVGVRAGGAAVPYRTAGAAWQWFQMREAERLWQHPMA